MTRKIPAKAMARTEAMYGLVMRRLDVMPRRYRQGVSVAASLLLHLALLLLLLSTRTGFSSIGTTGIGNVDGAGTTVTLVDASELMPPKPSQTESQPATAEQSPETAVEPTIAEAMDDAAKPVQAADTATETKEASTMQTVQSDSEAPSDSIAQATAGAHGQNGQANTDLWNAIAPCWNRIAGKDTLSATLTISFAADGGLSVPPIIERNPDAPITDQSLQSEAKALAALAACGVYPMVKGQQRITVVFPTPVFSDVKPARMLTLRAHSPVTAK